MGEREDRLPAEGVGPPGSPGRRALPLAADCARCFGLCCVALPFTASADFPRDKRAGEPCHHLQDDFRCGIHDRLRDEGWQGCTVFECFGAGQQVSLVTFEGRDWRGDSEQAGQMFAVFPVMRQLHEMLFHLTEALTWEQAAMLHGELRAVRQELERLAGCGPAPGRPAQRLPDCGEPAGRRPSGGRPARHRPARCQRARNRPHRHPLPHPDPGQRRPGRRAHEDPSVTAATAALASRRRRQHERERAEAMSGPWHAGRAAPMVRDRHTAGNSLALWPRL